jgi:hypothetical protein
VNFTDLKHIMVENANLVQLLVEDIPIEQARWKPDPDRWSILEVVNHLYDEEREDFRLHLDNILHHPEHSWAPIDPMGWITARKYNDRDLTESLADFLSERQQSLDWLEKLVIPNWESAAQAPWGPIKAGDMFASWVIHDQWHIQQLVRLRRDFSTHLAEPYDVQYAGTL